VIRLADDSSRLLSGAVPPIVDDLSHSVERIKPAG